MVCELLRRLWRSQRSTLFFVGILLCTVALGQFHSPSWAQLPVSPNHLPDNRLDRVLPQPRAHPLPLELAQWQQPDSLDDYFSEITPTPLGYLVWIEFPVKVFVEPAAMPNSPNRFLPDLDRSQQWVRSVTEAIEEWNGFLPLQQVDSAETANITIWRSAPPLQGWHLPSESNESGEQVPPTLHRVRAAETRYELFIDRSNTFPRLSHRFTIYLSPNQMTDYTKATARHEIGHALGIWGHSPVETDALYFSQVRTPALISDRDINTLKRIYEQPTRVGWAIELEE
jgi:predicted Zn-dependent protease